MFRTVLIVGIVLQFILTSVNGFDVHERDYCPFHVDGDVHIVGTNAIQATIQCNPNGTVTAGVATSPELYGSVNFHLELQCNNLDGNETFTNPKVLIGETIIQHNYVYSKIVDVDDSSSTNCTLYGCFFDVDLDIYEFNNVTCLFDQGFTTTEPSVTTSTTLGESSTQATVTTEQAETTVTADQLTGTDQTTEPYQSNAIAIVLQTTASSSTNSVPTTQHADDSTQPSPSSSRNLTTIITATVFASLVLLTCLCVTLSVAFIVYRRRQKRLFIRKFGHRGHHYDVTAALDPDFNPVDVRVSTTVRLAQSLHSILEPLKASTLNLKQQEEDENLMGYDDDDKSEILLQSQSSDECTSSHSVVLSIGEQSNNTIGELDSNDSNDRCQKIQTAAHALEQNAKSPDDNQGSDYIHEHNSSPSLPFNKASASSPSSYIQSIEQSVEQSTTQNSDPKKVPIPLKPLLFHSDYIGRYMRGQSDTSSCSIGLVSNTTNSSGYVSNSSECDSPFGGFLSQAGSSDYGVTASVATTSSGYVTESPGYDSPQKDVLGYLQHFNEDIHLPHFKSSTQTNPPTFDCIQDYEVDEENQSSDPQHQDKQIFSVKHSKEYTTKDSTANCMSELSGYVTIPQDKCTESRLHRFTDSDDIQSDIMLDTKTDVSSCEEEEILTMDDLNCVHMELDKNIFDATSVCSLSLNPSHFQPIDCDSDYFENM